MNRYYLVLQQWVEAEEEDAAKERFVDSLKHIKPKHIDVWNTEEKDEEEPTC